MVSTLLLALDFLIVCHDYMLTPIQAGTQDISLLDSVGNTWCEVSPDSKCFPYLHIYLNNCETTHYVLDT